MSDFYVYILIFLVALFLLRIVVRLVRFIKTSVGCWRKPGNIVFGLKDEENLGFRHSNLYCVLVKGGLLGSIGSVLADVLGKPKYSKVVCGPLGKGAWGELITNVIVLVELVVGPVKNSVVAEAIVKKLFTK